MHKQQLFPQKSHLSRPKPDFKIHRGLLQCFGYHPGNKLYDARFQLALLPGLHFFFVIQLVLTIHRSWRAGKSREGPHENEVRWMPCECRWSGASRQFSMSWISLSYIWLGLSTPTVSPHFWQTPLNQCLNHVFIFRCKQNRLQQIHHELRYCTPNFTKDESHSLHVRIIWQKTGPGISSELNSGCSSLKFPIESTNSYDVYPSCVCISITF